MNGSSIAGNSALIEASSRGHDACIQLLIDAGADVNEVRNNGTTSLIAAATRGIADTVQLLLESGADLNILGRGGAMALYKAAENGQSQCVNTLLTAGADVNRVTSTGNTVLYAANSRLYRNIDVVKLLLRAGTPINKTNSFGYNALTTSVSQSSAGVVRTEDLPDIPECEMLLFAGGEVLDYCQVETPDYLNPGPDLALSLKHKCREAIRKHLLNLDPYTHLFRRVQKLHLPSALTKYILYDMSLI